jgi:hypothetical protein
VGETVKAVTGVATGLVGFINPFVPGSTWRPTMGAELRVAIEGWIARYTQQPSGFAPAAASPGTFSPPTTSVQRTGIDLDTTSAPKVDAGKAFEQAATRALSAAYAGKQGKQKVADDADTDTAAQQQPRTAFGKPSSLIRGGNKSEPGKVAVGVAGAGDQKVRTTVAGAVKSVNDKIGTAVDKATDGLKRAKNEAKHGAAPAGDKDN